MSIESGQPTKTWQRKLAVISATNPLHLPSIVSRGTRPTSSRIRPVIRVGPHRRRGPGCFSRCGEGKSRSTPITIRDGVHRNMENLSSEASTPPTAARSQSSLLPVLGFGVLVLGGVAGLAYLASAPEPTSHRDPEPGVGQPLPDLQLSPLSPNAAPRGLEHLGGRVTFVNLWGPWCSYCRVELPHLNAIFQQHSPNVDHQCLSLSCA